MKKAFSYLPYLIYLSLTVLCVKIITFYIGTNAYGSDENIKIPKFMDMSLKFLYISCIIFFIIVLITVLLNKRHYLALAFCTAVICISTIVIANNLEHFYFSIERFQPIITAVELEKLELLISGEKEPKVVYIGRDNCPECVLFYPKLEKLSRQYQVETLYYNTIIDRETRPQIMTPILDKLNVKSVPAILGIKNGIVTELGEGNDIEKIAESIIGGRSIRPDNQFFELLLAPRPFIVSLILI